MDIVERLIKFKDYTGLTNSQFADRAGIPRPTLSQFLNGRNKRLSDDLTTKLHVAYPDLNVMWLLFGEGNMTTGQNFEISATSQPVQSPESKPKLSDNEAHISTQPSLFSIQDSEPIRENPTPNRDPEPQKPEFEPLRAADRFPQINLQQIDTHPEKHIQSIIVFYSDNSYEIFPPGDTSK